MLAILIKPTAGFSLIPIPLMLIYRLRGEKTNQIRAPFSQIFLGAFSLLLPILIFFMSKKALWDFYQASWAFNFAYISTTSIKEAWQLFRLLLGTAMQNVFVILPLLGLSMLLLKDAKRSFIGMIFTLTVCSLVGVFWGRRGYEHYFLQMTFPLALFTGLAIHAIAPTQTDFFKKLFCVVLISFNLMVGYTAFFSFKENLKNFESQPEIEVSRYLKTMISSNEALFVFGGQPIIYFLSQRYSPGRYFFWYHHKKDYEDILLNKGLGSMGFENRPDYIVFVKKSWIPSQSLLALIEIMRKEYKKIKTIEKYEVWKKISATPRASWFFNPTPSHIKGG